MAAQVVDRFHDSYRQAALDQDDDDDEPQENVDSPAPVLDGPYASLWMANFQKELQNSVNAAKKAYKNNKKMSYNAVSAIEIEEEPPKHEPPATPLPADNLRSCIKKRVVKQSKEDGKDGKGGKGGKAMRRKKVTWAPNVVDNSTPVASAEVPNTNKKNNKKNGKNVVDENVGGKHGKDKGGKQKDKGGKQQKDDEDNKKPPVVVGIVGSSSSGNDDSSRKGGKKVVDTKANKRGERIRKKMMASKLCKESK